MHHNGNNIDNKIYKREGALHTKGVQHLISVLYGCWEKDKKAFAPFGFCSPSLRPEKETVRGKSPKKLYRPCAVCHQTPVLSCDNQYFSGLLDSPQRKTALEIARSWHCDRAHHCSKRLGLCRSNYGSSMFCALYAYKRCFTFYEWHICLNGW